MRIGFQSAGCGFSNLTVCGWVLFLSHILLHTTVCWSITSFLFFTFWMFVCYLFVFSLFFWRRKTWETQTNIKNQFLFRSLVDFQLVQKHRAARHQKKKEVLPSPFWLSAGIKWIRSSCNRLKRGEKVAWKHQTAQVHLSPLSFLSSYFFFRTHPLVSLFFETLGSLRWMDGWNWWWWWGEDLILIGRQFFFRPSALLSSRLFSRVLTVISLSCWLLPLSLLSAHWLPLPTHIHSPPLLQGEILLHCWGEPNPPRDVCSHRRRRRRLPMRVWARAAAKQLVSVSSISCHTHTQNVIEPLSLALSTWPPLLHTQRRQHTTF